MSRRDSESEQRFRTTIKIILFLSSYVPLFAIIALRLGTVRPLVVQGISFPITQFEFYFSCVSTLILLFCIAISITLYSVMWSKLKSGTTQKIVDSYQKKNDLLSMYLLSYVFVFAGLMFSNSEDIAIFIMFFVMLAILQIQSEILHINPMLGICGFHAYEMTSNNQVMLVISNGPLDSKLMFPDEDAQYGRNNTNTKVKLVPLGGTTYLAP